MLLRGLTMGKKKSKNDGLKNDNKSGGGNKDDGVLTVVLKVDMHCEGCATKIRKCIRGFEGVQSMKGGDGDLNKLTVIGKVDPMKLREMVEQKAKRKVELVSPVPKKDKDSSNNEKDGGGGGEKKTGDKPEKKSDEKKSKEPPVTTAVMKVELHCQGCIQKIGRTVTKTKGYHDMSIDEQKNLVTVKGSMDMKALAESLQEKLKKPVQIVPPKKDDGGPKKEKGGEKGETAGVGVGGQAEENRIQQHAPVGYPNPLVNGYGLGYPIEQVHDSQMFSDENPNACFIM